MCAPGDRPFEAALINALAALVLGPSARAQPPVLRLCPAPQRERRGPAVNQRSDTGTGTAYTVNGETVLVASYTHYALRGPEQAGLTAYEFCMGPHQ